MFNFINRILASRKLRQAIQAEQTHIFIKRDDRGHIIDVSCGRLKEGWAYWERYTPASMEQRQESALKILGLD